ncbi:MAG TPA: hypothetical protein PLP14_00100 [Chitinophagaceae bacterium]|nr:hypothetical protein [Chitinophagaceae bacterium]
MTFKRIICTVIAGISLLNVARAQLPETEIYLLNLDRDPKGYHISQPVKLAPNKGYNNQPWFAPDMRYLYFVSSVDTQNTEIYRYDLDKKRTRRITHTRESEYSPRWTPDEEWISCVRVEKDGVTQHLCLYNKKGKKPMTLFPELKQIGYYEWITQNEFISFELPEPFSLVRHNLISKRSDTLAQQIGRCFYHMRTKSRMIYTDKSDSLHWVLRSVAPENLRTVRKGPKVENPFFAELLPGEEDFCFMRDGSILMGHEGKLFYKKNPFRHPDSKWEEWADLKSLGIGPFYRISISPDNTRLAIVVYKEKKP